jgi:hypothetical protein
LTSIDPLSNLGKPHIKAFTPDKALRKKIAVYFSLVLNRKISAQIIDKALPDVMPSWGRVRIGSGGDSIRTSSAMRNPDRERNMSFVRVSELHRFI